MARGPPGRSLIDVLNTVNLLRERRVLVRSISDGIDPTTSTGRLMLNMLATLAEYERELIVERVHVGISAARERGTRFGRPLSDPHVIADKLDSNGRPIERADRSGRSAAGRLEPGDALPPSGPSGSREGNHVADSWMAR